MVNFRYGSVADGGRSIAKPGVENEDDNNNNNPDIVKVEEISQASRISTFEGEPYAIVGNGIDDDGDGLIDEEDEVYIDHDQNRRLSLCCTDFQQIQQYQGFSSR